VAAGVDVRAWGEGLGECLRQCALAVFELIVPLAAVRPVEAREVSARGDSPEALLASWIDECLYLHDIEGFVVHEADPPSVGPSREAPAWVHGLLRGEALDPGRHPRGRSPRAAGQRPSVVDEDGTIRARFLLEG
jgi:SHS2 domain-containing protein